MLGRGQRGLKPSWDQVPGRASPSHWVGQASRRGAEAASAQGGGSSREEVPVLTLLGKLLERGTQLGRQSRLMLGVHLCVCSSCQRPPNHPPQLGTAPLLPMALSARPAPLGRGAGEPGAGGQVGGGVRPEDRGARGPRRRLAGSTRRRRNRAPRVCCGSSRLR